MQRLIAFLIFDRFQLLDAAGPIAAFEMPARGISPPPYAIKVLSRLGGAVASSCGVAMLSESLHTRAVIDTLVVVGGQGTAQAMQCVQTLAFVRRQYQRARRVCSVCSGAYVLAAAGLLNGRRATTHWGRSHDFAQRFPQVKLQPDQIYTQDGPLWTSAGITAGIDLALALIGQDLGQHVAQQTARQLVVYHRRTGGQTQFSALLEMDTVHGPFAQLLTWMREHVQDPLSVADLARQACMSERNFARQFTHQMGVTPAKALEKIRLELAREAVETGTASLESIAQSYGFSDADRMRKAFLRIFGQPPQSLRRRARHMP